MPNFNELLSSESMKNASLPKINSNFSNIFNYVYPVGSIYMSINNVSPATLFGGTWEQIKDTFLLSAGDTYTAGATGGSADAVVVQHKHFVVAGNAQSNAAEITTGTDYAVNNYKGSNGDSSYLLYYTPNAAFKYGDRGNSSLEGVSGTGKNMPPYLTVYMWKRTA